MSQKIWTKVLGIVFIIHIIAFPQTVKIVVANDLEILNQSNYLNSYGWYYIVGEVQNVGSTSLQFVKVTATYYDETGVVIGTDLTYTELDVILPSRKSPFQLVFTETTQIDKIHHYSLSVSSSFSNSPTQGLQIMSNSSYVGSYGWLYIVGEIKNIGSIATPFVKVIATCYNSTGHVIAVDFDYASTDPLAVNSVSPFEIVISDDQAPLVTSYDLTAESQHYAIIPEFLSWFILLILLPTLTVVMLVLRKRFSKNFDKALLAS